jgi:TP901 family phage tail tape measure protein
MADNRDALNNKLDIVQRDLRVARDQNKTKPTPELKVKIAKLAESESAITKKLNDLSGGKPITNKKPNKIVEVSSSQAMTDRVLYGAETRQAHNVKEYGTGQTRITNDIPGEISNSNIGKKIEEVAGKPPLNRTSKAPPKGFLTDESRRKMGLPVLTEEQKTEKLLKSLGLSYTPPKDKPPTPPPPATEVTVAQNIKKEAAQPSPRTVKNPIRYVVETATAKTWAVGNWGKTGQTISVYDVDNPSNKKLLTKGNFTEIPAIPYTKFDANPSNIPIVKAQVPVTPIPAIPKVETPVVEKPVTEGKKVGRNTKNHSKITITKTQAASAEKAALTGFESQFNINNTAFKKAIAMGDVAAAQNLREAMLRQSENIIKLYGTPPPVPPASEIEALVKRIGDVQTAQAKNVASTPVVETPPPIEKPQTGKTGKSPVRKPKAPAVTPETSAQQVADQIKVTAEETAGAANVASKGVVDTNASLNKIVNSSSMETAAIVAANQNITGDIKKRRSTNDIVDEFLTTGTQEKTTYRKRLADKGIATPSAAGAGGGGKGKIPTTFIIPEPVPEPTPQDFSKYEQGKRAPGWIENISTQAGQSQQKISAQRIAIEDQVKGDTQRKISTKLQRDYSISTDESARMTGKMTTTLRSNNITWGAVDESISSAILKVTLWLAATSVVIGTSRKLNEVLQLWKDLSIQIARVGIVTNATSDTLYKYFNLAADVAIQMGMPITDTLKGMDLALRATASLKDEATRTSTAVTMLRDASMLGNIAGMSFSQAMDVLVGSLRQTGMALDQGLTLMDKWVAVSKSAQVSVQDMAQSFSIMSAAGETAGVSIDQINGLVAAMSETTTLGPTEVGNSIRALMSTLYDPSAEKALGKYGIAVKTVTGDFRSFWDIMSEISALNKQKILSPDQLLEISKAAGAGQRRYAQFLALINNWDSAVRNSAVSSSALGDTLDANQRIINNLSNAFDQSTAAQNKFWYALGSKSGAIDDLTSAMQRMAGAFSWMADVNNGLARMVKVVLELVVAYTALKLAGAGAAKIQLREKLDTLTPTALGLLGVGGKYGAPPAGTTPLYGMYPGRPRITKAANIADEEQLNREWEQYRDYTYAKSYGTMEEYKKMGQYSKTMGGTFSKPEKVLEGYKFDIPMTMEISVEKWQDRFNSLKKMQNEGLALTLQQTNELERLTAVGEKAMKTVPGGMVSIASAPIYGKSGEVYRPTPGGIIIKPEDLEPSVKGFGKSWGGVWGGVKGAFTPKTMNVSSFARNLTGMSGLMGGTMGATIGSELFKDVPYAAIGSGIGGAIGMTLYGPIGMAAGTFIGGKIAELINEAGKSFAQKVDEASKKLYESYPDSVKIGLARLRKEYVTTGLNLPAEIPERPKETDVERTIKKLREDIEKYKTEISTYETQALQPDRYAPRWVKSQLEMYKSKLAGEQKGLAQNLSYQALLKSESIPIETREDTMAIAQEQYNKKLNITKLTEDEINKIKAKGNTITGKEMSDQIKTARAAGLTYTSILSKLEAFPELGATDTFTKLFPSPETFFNLDSEAYAPLLSSLGDLLRIDKDRIAAKKALKDAESDVNEATKSTEMTTENIIKAQKWWLDKQDRAKSGLLKPEETKSFKDLWSIPDKDANGAAIDAVTIQNEILNIITAIVDRVGKARTEQEALNKLNLDYADTSEAVKNNVMDTAKYIKEGSLDFISSKSNFTASGIQATLDKYEKMFEPFGKGKKDQTYHMFVKDEDLGTVTTFLGTFTTSADAWNAFLSENTAALNRNTDKLDAEYNIPSGYKTPNRYWAMKTLGSDYGGFGPMQQSDWNLFSELTTQLKDAQKTIAGSVKKPSFKPIDWNSVDVNTFAGGTSVPVPPIDLNKFIDWNTVDWNTFDVGKGASPTADLNLTNTNNILTNSMETQRSIDNNILAMKFEIVGLRQDVRNLKNTNDSDSLKLAASAGDARIVNYTGR